MIAMPIDDRPFLVASFALAIMVSTNCAPSPAAGADWNLVVRRMSETSVETPFVVEAPSSLPAGAYLVDIPGSSRAVSLQVFSDAGTQRLGCVLPAGRVDGSFPIRPQPPASADRSHQVLLIPGQNKVVIELDGALFSEYRTDVGAKPFLFPLIGPTGASYSRAFPMQRVAGEDHDHPHQRSFWFTHGNVNQIDFWSEEGRHGTIREGSRKAMISGPVLGRLRTTDDWIGPDGQKVCQDERVLTVYRVPEKRILDFEITIQAVAGAVTFGDTKEGMFGIRVASSMDVIKKAGGRIVSAQGLTDERAWGQPAPWVDYTGPVEGKLVGVAILNHPRSFRYPTAWHVRTYGLFAANPFGWHDFGLGKTGRFTLAAGQQLWFGYRVILHEQDTQSARIAAAFDAFASAPQVEVTSR
jgi:hypothetical protein